MKRISSLLLLLGTSFSCYAQQILTLDSCRALALANNKELRISQEKVNAAHYEKKQHSLIICLRLTWQEGTCVHKRNIPAQ